MKLKSQSSVVVADSRASRASRANRTHTPIFSPIERSLGDSKIWNLVRSFVSEGGTCTIHATWMRITSLLRKLGTLSSATAPMTPWAMSRMVEAVSMEWRNRHMTPPSTMMMANPGGKVISYHLSNSFHQFVKVRRT